MSCAARAPLSRAMAPWCLKKALGAKEAPISVINGPFRHGKPEMISDRCSDNRNIILHNNAHCCGMKAVYVPLMISCSFAETGWQQAFFDCANRYGRSRNMEHFIASDFVRIGVVADS